MFSTSHLRISRPKPLKPSSNWLALQKEIKSNGDELSTSRKRRKLSHYDAETPTSFVITEIPKPKSTRNAHQDQDGAISLDSAPEMKNGEDLTWLRNMVMGKLKYKDSQMTPGKFLALDCEMVGVGEAGQESSLARVSLINYHGFVILDEFVKQKERVTDWRTEWSGIRASDMAKAKPFENVQKSVSDLLHDRIAVGHAVYNDLKVLLLSHPWHLIRDTQVLAGKQRILPTKYPALRNLVKHELSIQIQGSEHSSVTDARATMAVYRIHRKEWDKSIRLPKTITPMLSAAPSTTPSISPNKAKRKWVDNGDDSLVEKIDVSIPRGGRKGVSSGLGIIRKRITSGISDAEPAKTQWWKDLSAR